MHYRVNQDGANFYLYHNGSGLVCTISAPIRVRDFELTKAQQARQWFEGLAKQWGWTVTFEA